MKKIIDGKLYDTDKATLVVEWDNGYLSNDFNYEEESLYQTKNGNWFVHCSGGPNTSCAERCGSDWCGGEDIAVLNENEVKKWLEDKNCTSKLLELFGDEIQEA